MKQYPTHIVPRPRRHALAVSLLALGLTACAVGPDYVRPKLELPQSFREAAGWQPAQPRDNQPRGNWWEVYGDSQLNALMEQVQVNNLNVQQAEAQYRQAHALVQEARAAFLPAIAANAGTSRQSSSAVNSATGGRSTTTANVSNLTLSASWVPDIWGRVRRQVEAGTASAQVSQAEFAAALLSAQGELAQDYFQLRILDAEAELYEHDIGNFQRSLQITKNQFAVGIVTVADVSLAQTQLLSVQAQATDLAVQRGQLEHAIALLIGKTPGEFSLAPAPLKAELPALPATGVPADLLERRPDIAAAERQVAVANANIGVARSAYFPTLTLTGSGGLEGSTIASLFSTPTRVWAVGAALGDTLFDAGLRRAQNDAAVAAYDAQVAAYKQTVLGALNAVEDNLLALRVLEQESTVQGQAVQAAQRSATLALNQYLAGTTTYLSVVTAQATQLNDEIVALQLRGRRFSAHVLLIEALGGSALAQAQQLTGAPQSQGASSKP